MTPGEAAAAIRAAAAAPPTPKIRARYQVGIDPAGDQLTFAEVTPGGRILPMPAGWDGTLNAWSNPVSWDQILRTYAGALANTPPSPCDCPYCRGRC